jgi:pheromone shutdown protein TraB
MTDENADDEEEGITIEISNNIDDDSTEENANEQTEDHTDEEGEDFLDEDGTVTIQDDRYEGTVRLVGTVHVSKQTRERVVDTVQEESPDAVAIELDRDRLYDMFERGADVVGGEVRNDEDEGFSLRDVIRQQQEGQFDGDDMLQPGEADMIPAVREGEKTDSRVALVDMSVGQLKQNVKENAFDEDGNLDIKMLNKVMEGSFGEVVERVKQFTNSRGDMRDTLEEEGMSGVIKEMERSSIGEVNQQMEPLREIAPEVVEALIDERDRYMAGRIHWLRKNGYDTVAAMGRGHLQGVYHYLQNSEELDEEYVVEPDWYEYSNIEISS